MKRTLMFLAAATPLLGSLNAHASTVVVVPDATFNLVAGGQTFKTPGTFSGTSCGGPGGGGCETSTASADTSLVLQTTGTGSLQWSSAPQAVVGVFYQVVGPASIAVPITIAGYGSVSLSAYSGYALSEIQAGNGYINATAIICTGLGNTVCGSNNSPSPSAGPLTASLSVNSNAVYEFVMQTGCSALGGTCSTYLDPTVTIDPTFLANHPGYSVALSPNITSVPLPASAWLLLSSVVGLGAMARKSRAV